MLTPTLRETFSSLRTLSVLHSATEGSEGSEGYAEGTRSSDPSFNVPPSLPPTDVELGMLGSCRAVPGARRISGGVVLHTGTLARLARCGGMRRHGGMMRRGNRMDATARDGRQGHVEGVLRILHVRDLPSASCCVILRQASYLRCVMSSTTRSRKRGPPGGGGADDNAGPCEASVSPINTVHYGGGRT